MSFDKKDSKNSAKRPKARINNKMRTIESKKFSVFSLIDCLSCRRQTQLGYSTPNEPRQKGGDSVSNLGRGVLGTPFRCFANYAVKILPIIACLAVLTWGSGCGFSWQRPQGQTSGISSPPVVDPVERLAQTVSEVNWLVTLSIIGVGAGVFAFLSGSSKGLQLMAACFVILSLSLMVVRYAAWMAFFTIVGAVSLAIYTVLVRNKAVHELVAGAEKLKKALPDRSVFKETIGKQSKTTKQIVAQERLALQSDE